jgi:hypothetical protein
MIQILTELRVQALGFEPFALAVFNLKRSAARAGVFCAQSKVASIIRD